jgi:hypothetical protein
MGMGFLKLDGDPGGSMAVGTFKAHLVLDRSVLPRNIKILEDQE